MGGLGVRGRLVSLVALCAVAVCCGCGSIRVKKSTDMLDYLYPKGTPAIPPQDVTLHLPVRVGLAFPPGESRKVETGNSANVFEPNLDSPVTEVQRQQLLERIAAAFRGRDG